MDGRVQGRGSSHSAGSPASARWTPPGLRGDLTRWLRGDVIAGVTVWAVLVPESIAYATIAGVPPIVGLYAAPAALLLYALLGSSRQLVVGPMSSTALLSAAVVAGLAGGAHETAALTTGLALVAGTIALVAGLLRLGFVASFISEPVLKGFVVGLALTIIVGQLPKLTGGPGGDGEFLGKVWGFLSGLGGTDAITLAVGGTALVLLLLFRRLLPVVPASLVVVVLAVTATWVLGLDRHGVDIVGTLPSGLPDLGLPTLDRAGYASLIAGGAGIALVGFAEGLGAARTYAAKSGARIDSDRELLGLGGANLASGLCSGMVVNGSLSKTAVNGAAGARSQVSGLTAALLTVLTLLFLTGLFEKLPEAVLAAVVIAAVLDLVDLRALRDLYRLATPASTRVYGVAARSDFLGALAALAGVLLLGTLKGLLIGVGVSLLLLVSRSSRPHIAELGRVTGDDGLARWVDRERDEHARPEPGVSVLRVEGGLYFANSEYVHDRVVDAALPGHVRDVVLDVRAVPFVDATAARMVDRLAESVDRHGSRLLLARDLGQVRDQLRRTDLLHPSVEDAVRAARDSRRGAHSGSAPGEHR
ncbi:SulP family inorganic anion transporter [Murinocardiopsis flavida]|uniref:SulP family inorganic anion transporter n=1 Tax=Murinocardiopsis flavida TaxID=645275 RepID=UPI001FE5EC8E|nr:sulfate permease [Murinocardiopsis flavida]